MEKEVNPKIFLIAIIAIVVIVLISNNFNLTGSAVIGKNIEQQVKCVFANSITTQKCYLAGRNEIGCSGIETCVVSVKGFKGERLTWKSSCGGDAYTTIDGKNEYAEFKCDKVQQPVPSSSGEGRVSTDGFRDILKYMAVGGKVIRTATSDTTCTAICSNEGRLCAFGIAHLFLERYSDNSASSFDGIVACNENLAYSFGNEATSQFQSKGYRTDVDSECLCF